MNDLNSKRSNEKLWLFVVFEEKGQRMEENEKEKLKEKEIIVSYNFFFIDLTSFCIHSVLFRAGFTNDFVHITRLHSFWKLLEDGIRKYVTF